MTIEKFYIQNTLQKNSCINFINSLKKRISEFDKVFKELPNISIQTSEKSRYIHITNEMTIIDDLMKNWEFLKIVKHVNI